MEKYRMMLRQILSTNLSPNQIASQRGMSHHTVRRWRDVALAQGLTLAQLEILSHAELRRMFKPSARAGSDFVVPDWEAEAAKVRAGHSRLEAHTDYVARVGAERALAYRSYCEHLRDFIRVQHPVMRLEHVAGYEMQTDFAGDLVPGREDGSNETAHFKLFVAILPFSRLTAAHLVRSERVNDHIEANIAVLEYFGGAPMMIRPDNLKAAVVSRPRYGAPRLQESYQAFVDHYGMGADPARPRRPQDKAAVENAVKLLQRLMKQRLRNMPLLPLVDLRKILAETVEMLNTRILRRAGGHSRKSLFEAEERAHLRALPSERFEPFEPACIRQVHKDYHIEFKGNYYSVPHALIGKPVSVRPNAVKVEVLHEGQSVAIHVRSHRQGQTITDPQHRPENHAACVAIDLVEWAQVHGTACETLARAEVVALWGGHKRQVREKWIMSLPRRFGRQRFSTACTRAVEACDLRFEHVENVLKRGIEASPHVDGRNVPITPVQNVRGAGYYDNKDH